MARIIINNSEYSLFDFDSEAEFEKAVIENQKYLFGKDSVYVDVKRRIGRDNHRGIPDQLVYKLYGLTPEEIKLIEDGIPKKLSMFFSGRSRGEKRAIYVINSPLEPEVKDIFMSLTHSWSRRLSTLSDPRNLNGI